MYSRYLGEKPIFSTTCVKYMNVSSYLLEKGIDYINQSHPNHLTPTAALADYNNLGLSLILHIAQSVENLN